jgi:hypothetical protein
MRHATALLYHVCAVASRNIRFVSCGTSGKLTLWTRYVTKYTGQLEGNKKLGRNSRNELILYAIYLKPDEYFNGSAIKYYKLRTLENELVGIVTITVNYTSLGQLLYLLFK